MSTARVGQGVLQGQLANLVAIVKCAAPTAYLAAYRLGASLSSAGPPAAVYTIDRRIQPLCDSHSQGGSVAEGKNVRRPGPRPAGVARRVGLPLSTAISCINPLSET